MNPHSIPGKAPVPERDRAGRTRRQFLCRTVVGGMGVAACAGGRGPVASGTERPPSRVALTAGADRADNVFRGLQAFKREIAAAIGRKRVLLKPNLVIGSEGAAGGGKLALSTTHRDALGAVLEFLGSIGKTDVVIAESSATDAAMTAYENAGYLGLAREYPVRLLGLDQEGFDVVPVWSGGRASAARRLVRVARLLRDPDVFVISVTRFKTHNCVLYTLSLKNVVMASACNDPGIWIGQAGSRADKQTMHGDGSPGYQDLNDNLHELALRGVTPDLAVLDGCEGMQGDGPIWGQPVPHQVAVVGLDWLAADRVALELMGVTRWDLARPDKFLPPYLTYCGQSGLGEFDLANIAVEGERLADHVVRYELHAEWPRMLGAAAGPRRGASPNPQRVGGRTG